jgi:predicted O-linked N-acetylglucosamine transferase (SPINDLY family)
MATRHTLTRTQRQQASALLQNGQYAAAQLLYEEMCRANPRDDDAWFTLGAIHHQLGETGKAIECYTRTISLQPKHADALYYLGTLLQNADKLDEAISCYQRALSIKPDYPGAYCNLGTALESQKRFDEAVEYYRRGLREAPDSPELHYNLGNALKSLVRLEDAVGHYRTALRLKPDFAQAHANLGGVLDELGRTPEAQAHLNEALRLNPDYPEALNNLGFLLYHENNLDQALAALERALNLRPDYAEAHNNMGLVYSDKGDIDRALASYRRALEHKEDLADAYNNLAGNLFNQGHLEEAADTFTKAIAHGPDISTFQSNYLLALNYRADLGPGQVFAEHQRLGGTYPAPTIKRYPNTPEPQRKLRVGYVSPDFRFHSVAFFLEPILKAHDRSRVDIYCYADVARPDSMTGHLKELSNHWRNIRGKADQEVADQIQTDEIDILIDLAGHTGNNRLPVFARKPAPVQVTYLGYPNTTGLSTIDYRLTDLEADPIGQEAFHTEQLVRLPHGFLCYTPPPDAPEVATLPVLAAGHITFGSFNNLAKMTPKVIGLWARILKAVPESRLVIKNRSMKDGPTRERYLTLFRDADIGAEQLDLVAWIPEAAGHLGTYARVDIALDTFPYHGTTTTCEALWMGVPVVTLAGDRHAARVGVSLLTRVGLTELIAPSSEEYVQRAVELAGDTERLVQLRAGMRERVSNSPLCDVKSFTRALEGAYREMWREWCAGQAKLKHHQRND